MIDKRNGGLDHLPEQDVAIPVYVECKINIVHTFAMLPGKSSVGDMTAPLTALLKMFSDDFYVVATERVLWTPLL